MFNKNSCRMCGSSMTPSAICRFCKESVSWTSKKCNKMDEVTHSDYYCTLWMSRRLELGLEDSNRFELIINR